MSKPTPQRLMKKELKRKAERKIMRKLGFNSPMYKMRKLEIIGKVLLAEEASRKKTI